jgi:uncharacterized repeat protein (TIGR03803 family)
MKNISLSFVVLLICSISTAQTFVGMTYGGGAHSCGTIFQMTADGSNFHIVYSFDTLTGMNPYGSLLQASDGKLYGLTFQGGANHLGTIFSYDLLSHVYTDMYDFSYSGHAYGSLVELPGHRLYGMTSDAGKSAIFYLDMNDNSYHKDYEFVDSTGSIPKGDLLYCDSFLYGLTSCGGTGNTGVLFRFDPYTHICKRLVCFSGNNGEYPFGNLAYNNYILYGTTRQGGTSNAGTLFQYNINTQSYSKLYDFSNGSAKKPAAGCLVENDRLYGLAQQGGSHNHGAIYSYDLQQGVCSIVFDFDSVSGASPSFNSVVQSSNGKLYGMTLYGGDMNMGVIFRFDTIANIYDKLTDFDVTNGKWPNGTLTELNPVTNAGNEAAVVVFNIYPDPVSSNLYLTGMDTDHPGEICIFDTEGRRVYETTVAVGQPVQVESFASGIYILQLKSTPPMRKLFVKK